MKIAILDDNEKFCQNLKMTLEDIIPSHINPLFVEIFTHPVHFLEAYQRESYDILFLDMDLRGVNGVDIGLITRQENKRLCIIVLSAFDYRYDSYLINPIQYLSKPVNERELKETLIRALLYCQKRYFLFKTYNETIPIDTKDIIYMKTSYNEMSVYVKNKVYTGSKRSNMATYSSLYLPSFYKLDRSTIINFTHLVKEDSFSLKMSDDTILEVSRNKRKEFREAFISFLETGISKN